MDKQLKCIDLVMENCEIFRVNIDNISCFSLDGITKRIRAYRCHEGKLTESNNSTGFSIYINNVDNVEKTFSYENSPSFIERINKHKDLCNVDLIYDDGSNFYCTVPMSDEYVNKYQHHEKYHENGITIIIDKDYTEND